ncbi:hypothetical protein [uncultured Parabacteroides sp.]|uniref:hypothetical protein n=1 Tax=uncultured Parabacteroides sp. TaxID=512312 RepID=UPI00258ABA68|nr:hypothetical protein [uncultured Parabacteroides sp.]
MDLRQKLALETADSKNIYLYREGLFWKAYERSAIKFIQTITAYQVNTRFCKVVNMEVISLGFPDAVLPKILENREYEKIDEKRLAIHSVLLGDEKFMAAKSQYISKMMSDLKKETAQESGLVPKEPDVGAQVLERLRLYNIAGVTPIDCMIFLSSLKKQLENNILFKDN